MRRELSDKGHRQAARMAKWLDRQLPQGSRIFCSPARRAEQTVAHLGRKFKIRDELSPQCDHQGLLALVQWPHAKMTALVVGHQPALGQAIAEIFHLPHDAVGVRKGSVWWLRARQREDQIQTQLWTIQLPELL